MYMEKEKDIITEEVSVFESVSGSKNRPPHVVVAASIILAGILIAASILYVGTSFGNVGKTASPAAPSQSPQAQGPSPVTASDHILGNPQAPVKLVEFSDLECPFCKDFHATLQQVAQAYPGQVAIVYRHFPLTIHPKAPHEAEAAECAAQLGGNDAFWKYVDGIFAITPSNNGLDPAELPIVAQQIGLDVNAFNACLSKEPFKDKIQSQLQDGIAAGVQGTPTSFVIAPNGTVYPINGAEPYSVVKGVIDVALQQK